MNHRSQLSLALALSLSLSLMTPICLSAPDAEAKPGPSSPIKAKTSPKTTKKGESRPLQKRPAKAAPAKAAPAKAAPTKSAPQAPRTIGAQKSPSRTTSGGKSTGFKAGGAKGVGPARPSKGGELAPEGSTKPSVGSFEAPARSTPKAPSTTVVRPVDAPHSPGQGSSAPRPSRRVLGEGDEPRGKGVKGPRTTSTTTTSTTTSTSHKRTKGYKKGVRTSSGVQHREESYQGDQGGYDDGGGYGAPAPSYGGGRSSVPTCRPEGNKVMVNLGLGFESTQELSSSNMTYVLGGGLRSGFLGVAGEVQLNQKDGESEMIGWGGQVRLYLPLGSCLDVYPLAGISQQQAGLDQFQGTTNAFDVGVGADFNIFGAVALGARYTRSFFADELKAVNTQTTNSRDTFVVQLSIFF
jgi:hypothetical protein